MRNVPLDNVDALARPVLAIGTDYPKGTLLDTHRHRRAQFLYGVNGLMEVTTRDGAWVIPAHTGVWIPAGMPHRVRMVGVSTHSMYVDPRVAPRQAHQCEVLRVSALLHALLTEAIDVPALYAARERDGALMTLLLHEISRAPVLPFFAPLPRDPALAALCLAFLHAPRVHVSPRDWARRLHRSDRTFSRLFRLETGVAFGEWRQQACLLAALSRLSAGHSVTAVALELGYDSPGAFSTMFRKRLGAPPSSFQT